MPEENKFISALQELRKNSKKRNFSQSVDLIIALKGLDLKKPENKIKGEVLLPINPRKQKIGIFADSLIPQVKKLENENVIMVRKEEIEEYGRNKKRAKKLAKECKSFLAEAPLMTLVGKYLGQFLAPRGKMPKPIPPNVIDIKPLIERAENTVSFSLKDSPVISCIVGKEDMKDEDIAKNIDAVLKTVEPLLPKGKEQIKNIYLKLTMGKPVKVII